MEQKFHRHGLELSRQTMANWLLDSADLWLKPIYECLHKKLLTHEVLHAAKALGYFSEIFKHENTLAKKSVEERYAKRLELEKLILDELFAWAEKLYVTPKSKLCEAVIYLRNQRKYLYNYLLDGRLEASNNRAERSVKPFVIFRKNFLFANTAGGAEGSSIIFSLIETAKENKLDPYRYLRHVLQLAPTLDQSKDDWIVKLLPENAPENCKANYREK